MARSDVSGDCPEPLSMARQPIFDANRRLWGYTLSCIDACGPAAIVPADAESAAARMAASALIGIQQMADHKKKIMLEFNQAGLLNHIPYALPPSLVLIQIDPELADEPAVMARLTEYKTDGYAIAVNGLDVTESRQPLYDMADIIILNATIQDASPLADQITRARAFSAQLMAQWVDDAERFRRCLALEMDLFSGAFFKRPDKITLRKLTSNETARLNLLHAIDNPDPDVDHLAETIQSDAAISFRLLAYLNSAAFGFRQSVKSIRQAITLLGWRHLKQWLRVVLLMDMSTTPEAPELMTVAALRGRFLEQVARDHDYWGFDPENLHLFGLFSLLDAMLGMPMAEIVDYLPLDNRLKGALRAEPNNEYAPLLRLAQCLEESRWDDGRVLIRQLNLDPVKVNAAFHAAVDWTAHLTAMDMGRAA